MEQLVNFIIRPPRADYSPQNDLLDQEFMLKGRWYQRKDLEVKNGRGNVLKCSHYMPLVMPEGKPLPCVIYCHGNSGCRADASEAAIILLPSNITLFTLDFSGSGLSEGEHVTLGWYEKDDLKAVVEYLRTDGNVSCIGLWGRSMGAVTSLMYGAEDPSIAGMVLDSPFSNLVELMMELVDTYKYPLPKFTVKLAIQHMRRVIKKKANFDIMDLDTIQVAKCCFVPVLLGHATDDDFINPHHSDRIYESCVGDKNIIKFDGDHNSPRPQFYFDSISIFFQNVLNPPEDIPGGQFYDTTHDVFDRDAWDTVHASMYGSHTINGQPAEPGTESTEDAILQLRSRRPMSRTEVPPDISSLEKPGIEVNGTDGPSSSSGIPNGSALSQLIPVTSDDEYVEYTFGNSSDMPSSTEDEERMIMEAIIQSLKDIETKNPQEDAEPTDSSSDVSLVPNTEHPDSSSNVQKKETITICTPTEPTTVNPTSTVSTSQVAESMNADMADGTRATLVVDKSASGQAVEGFARRWRLNFFKNKR